ncbi:MAG TPA: metal-dependent hydrolase [Planctomycetaceae bacterium]|nr:metal-dependent hydrolase [Planctomycetaceae bacterium]HRF02602.1 DinB family protein [Pirellulaceae bacterium]
MNAPLDPPLFPAGELAPSTSADPRQRLRRIDDLAAFPGRLGELIAGLDDRILERPYRNWTLRQIVHHLADAQLHGYLRFKAALAEELPTIRPFDETAWSARPEARSGPMSPTIDLLMSLYKVWVDLIRQMAPHEWERAYFHPEANAAISLDRALAIYEWHGRHHLAQIVWRVEHLD